LGPAHHLTTESSASLAQVLARSGELSEAAAMLENITGLQGMQWTNSRSYWAQAAQALIEALRSQGNELEADRWAQTLAEHQDRWASLP